MPKRKASFAFPYERPRKLNKKSSEATVSETLNALSKRTSTPKKPLAILKWPSVNEHRTHEITENSVSPPLTDAGSSTPPSLRRASTLTLEDLNVGQIDDINASSSSETKSKTAVSSSVPRIPSGLTNFALGTDSTTCDSLRISKSTLITDVDDTEFTSALESLKSRVKKQPTTSKSPSIKAVKSLKRASSCKKNMNEPKDEHSSKEDNQEAEFSNFKKSEDSVVLNGNDFMEVVIAFDLTEHGLTSGVLEVYTNLQVMHGRLKRDIAGIRLAFIVFGASKDGVKSIDFGASLSEKLEFLEHVLKSYARGPQTIYAHDILKRLQREFVTWTPDSRRHVIFINSVHPGKSASIALTQSCEALEKMDVKIYGVQMGWNLDAAKLNFKMAKITGGLNLRLTLFQSLIHSIVMICLRESNPFNLQVVSINRLNIIENGLMGDKIGGLCRQVLQVFSVRRWSLTQTYGEEMFKKAIVPGTDELRYVWKYLCSKEEPMSFTDKEPPLKIEKTKQKSSATRKQASKPPLPTKQYFTRSKGTVVDGKEQIKGKRKVTSSEKKNALKTTTKTRAKKAKK